MAMVHVEKELHAKLQDLAAGEHRSMSEVIAEAVRQYERQKFWQGVQQDFARLQADPVAWKDYQDELALWDSLAGDGLENEEPYYMESA